MGDDCEDGDGGGERGVRASIEYAAEGPLRVGTGLAATAGRDAGTVPGGGVAPCLPARRRKGGLDKRAQPRDGGAAQARLPCAVPA